MAKKKAKKTAPKRAKKIVKRTSKKAAKSGAKKKIVVKKQKTKKPAVKTIVKTVSKAKRESFTFRPLRDRVLVRRDIETEKTSGGLFIPTTALEKPLQGEVIAVGTGSFSKKGKFKALALKVGDRVAFNKYAGQEINLNGEDLVVLRESEVIGFVD